jgi:hypothetical protein
LKNDEANKRNLPILKPSGLRLTRRYSEHRLRLRAHIGLCEYPLNSVFADVKAAYQLSTRPMRGAILRAFRDRSRYLCLQFRSPHRRLLARMSFLDQSGDAMVQEAFFPTRHSESVVPNESWIF